MAPKKSAKKAPKKAAAAGEDRKDDQVMNAADRPKHLADSGKKFVVPSFPLVVYHKDTGQMRTVVDEHEYNLLGSDWVDDQEKLVAARSPRLSGEGKREDERKDDLRREQLARDGVRTGALPANSPDANLSPVIASPSPAPRPEPSASGSKAPERKAEPKAGKARAAGKPAASPKASAKKSAKAPAKSKK